MSALIADIRHGLRLLRRSPAFAVVTIATLAVGIGASTAMFSVIDGVLFKRLPVEDQNRLLVAWTSIPERGFEHWALSYTSFSGIRERLRTTRRIAAHPYSGAWPSVLHRDDGLAMVVQQTAVTGEWFDVVGVRARAGRLLTAADDRAGAPHVVVLASRLAERLFGSAADAIGRRIRLQESTFTVVGVAPAAFDYPRTTEAWVASVLVRDSPYAAWDMVVRVAPGSTTEQTVADLTSALRALPPEGGPLGGVDKSQTIHAQTFADVVVGNVRPALLMLGGGVMLMLVVAGVNVANLLIVRGLARRRELSIRAAIGAGRARLLRQLGAEAATLASIAAILAVAVAFWVLKALIALAPPELPRLAEIAIDGHALAFTVGIAMAVTVLCGLLPALTTAHVEPAEALRAPDGAAASVARRLWSRHALVVAQLAITMLVLSWAGLLMKSVDRLQRLDVGFASRDLFLAEIAIPPSRYAAPVDLQRAMVRLAERLATMPAIDRATALSSEPFAGTQGVDATVFAEGQRLDERANPIVNYEGADASYFATLGLPIRRGRGIERGDGAASQPVVVVNEAFARVFWPGEDPIGRRIKWGSSASEGRWFTVVGLAGDTRYRELTTARPSVYVPYPQGIPVSPGYLAVRARDPVPAAAAIRRAVAEQEPSATVMSIRSLPGLLAAPLARPRFQTTLAGCFGAVALGLSLVGAYGVLSFMVRQRRREIGIRMALGAAPSDVRGMVLGQGLAPAAVGVLLGAASVLASGRFVQPLLFEVNSHDPMVLAGTAAGLLFAVFVAALRPTRAATRTDPLLVLRSD